MSDNKLSCIVLSKDRAAQLDLCLQSLASNAPGLVSRLTVIWTASSESYRKAYKICADEHTEALFVRENDFARQVRAQLEQSQRYVMFLCDDDIVHRWWAEGCSPGEFLHEHPEILSVSLRLGRRHKSCYSMGRPQQVPLFTARTRGFYVWKWAAEGTQLDWAYLGSVDGDVWRKDQLRFLLQDGDWASPNTLEEHLNREAKRTTLTPYMACYENSLVLGNPVNRAQDTHPNRAGDSFPVSLVDLNRGFLDGRRLRVQDLVIGDVKAAHHEVDLRKEEA